MVEVKYNGRTLVESMKQGQTLTLQSHNYTMPGNFTLTTDPSFIKPEGKKSIIYTANGIYTEPVREFEYVEITVSGSGLLPSFEETDITIRAGGNK